MATGMTRGEISADNRAYVGRVVAERTGMTQAEAEARAAAAWAETLGGKHFDEATDTAFFWRWR